MRLVIVTINYNGSENTIKLLESLKDQTDKDFEIIVVDNNSNSEEKAKLKNHKTDETNIVFIENNENLGYSGGNNVGIKKALEPWKADLDASVGAGWVLLLNNDTWVDSAFISRLKANLEGKGGIVGIAIDEGDPDALVGAGRTVYAGRIQWLKPTLSHITTRRVVMAKSVDNLYAIGGAMLIHTNVFDKIEFLDENYFLYFEDADFCQRARKAGVSVSFLPEIKISHSVSSSTKKLGSPTLLRYHYRNALYFNLKNGPWYIKLLVWPWSWIIATKQLIKIMTNKNKEESKAIESGLIDFYKNKYGKI